MKKGENAVYQCFLCQASRLQNWNHQTKGQPCTRNFSLVQIDHICRQKNIYVNEELKFVLDEVESIMGKQKMLVTGINFTPFPMMSSKGFYSKAVKCQD